MIKREPAPIDCADEIVVTQSADHLCALEVVLRSPDVRTRYEAATSKLPPRLWASNADVTQLSETIFAFPAKDSAAWYFWFSWGDEICPVTERETAARKITDLLATRKPPSNAADQIGGSPR